MNQDHIHDLIEADDREAFGLEDAAVERADDIPPLDDGRHTYRLALGPETRDGQPNPSRFLEFRRTEAGDAIRLAPRGQGLEVPLPTFRLIVRGLREAAGKTRLGNAEGTFTLEWALVHRHVEATRTAKEPLVLWQVFCLGTFHVAAPPFDGSTIDAGLSYAVHSGQGAPSRQAPPRPLIRGFRRELSGRDKSYYRERYRVGFVLYDEREPREFRMGDGPNPALISCDNPDTDHGCFMIVPSVAPPLEAGRRMCGITRTCEPGT